MVGKKKGVSGQKETSQAETGEEGKENREKGGEKDVARRRGGAPRKGRGASRGRECKYSPTLYFFYSLCTFFRNYLCSQKKLQLGIKSMNFCCFYHQISLYLFLRHNQTLLI